jgi:hypothetical protein
VDFYHMADNDHKARRAVFGEEAAEAKGMPEQRWAAGVA